MTDPETDPLIQQRIRELESRQEQLLQISAALQNSTEFLDVLIETLPFMIFVKRAQDLSFVRFNRSGERLLGYSRNELIGKTDYDFFPKDQADRFTAKDREVLACGKPVEIPMESLVTRTEGLRYLRTIKFPIYNAEGAPLYLVGVSEDITGQRALKDFLKLQSTALHSIANSVLISDIDGHILWVNQALERETGYSQSELLGRRTSIFKSGQHPVEFYKNLWDTIKKGEIWHGEVINRRKNGAVYTEEMTITPIIVNGESIDHFVAVKRDISSRKELEQQAHDNAKLLETLLDTIPSPVYYKDTSGRYLGCNQAFTRDILGLPKEQIIGKRLTDFTEHIPEHLTAFYTEKDRQLFQNPGVQRYEGDMLCADGVTRPFLCHKATFTDASGQVLGLVGVMLDLQDQQAAATQKRDSERQLLEAHRLEAIGQLAAGIAHEINTPVQYVGDNSRFLKETFEQCIPLVQKLLDFHEAYTQNRLDPALAREISDLRERIDIGFALMEAPRAISESLEGVKRVATIVRAMKEFSHPGSPEKSIVDVNRIIENTIDVSRNEWKYVADLDFLPDPALPKIPCQRGEISQSLLNLVINATHAVREKINTEKNEKGKITIRTARCGDQIEIQIEDTGVGIPESIRNKVFNAFFTTKPVGKGTGQGLAIARNVIVNKHKGSITFDSRPGEGTIFYIRLPVSPESKSG